MVHRVHSSLSQTSKYAVSQCPFIFNVFSGLKGNSHCSLYISPSSFFPLFQNKLDFSPGSSVQGNPLEKGPGSGEISLLLVEEEKYMEENGRETKTSAAVLSRVISIPSKPFLLIGPLHGWKCAPRPHWGTA